MNNAPGRPPGGVNPEKEPCPGNEEPDALAVFREALEHHAPAGGLGQVRRALHAEMNRGSNGRAKIPPRLLRHSALAFAASLLLLAAVARLISGGAAEPPVPCPHGSAAAENLWRRTAPDGLSSFLQHPDDFTRICSCRPKYSGSLRENTPLAPAMPPGSAAAY